MTVKTWVCNICGDPYIGEERPSHCPFCGAPAKYITEGKNYKEPKIPELTEVSRNNILAAIKLEVGNAEFYFCASRKAENLELKKRFKALGKVESEHASLLSKLLPAQPPSISRDKDTCQGEDVDFIKESHDREQSAIEHYTKFLEQATEDRVKQVFAAIVEVETTHIELADSK